MKLPVATATLRDKRAAGVKVAKRERVTNNKYVVPSPSTYVCYREVFLWFKILYSKTI